MKIRIHRPRSCLGWFLWLLGILLSLALLNNLYARARIFAAQAAAYELAGELGYTPADILRTGTYPANVDIITGSAVCTTKFVFVTPLDLPDFEAAAGRATRRQEGPSTLSRPIEETSIPNCHST